MKLFKGIILMYFWSFVSGRKYASIHPDIELSITELITKYGYPVETHEVTTEDGYILTIYRIPHGKNSNGINKRPILMMPGLASKSEHFIVGGLANTGFAYYLADQGYDVWLGNNRGSEHGTRHVTLDSRDSDFWKFSWHQIGIYDLPAIVDYILQKTRKTKLYYIGHSQGGTIFYVLASLRPEYQEKFAVACLLAPSGLTKYVDSHLFKPIMNNYMTVTRLIDYFNIYEWPPFLNDLRESLLELCFGVFYNYICENVFLNVSRANSNETNLKLFPFMIGAWTSSSILQTLHYAQNMMSRHFRQWDYGKVENIKVYGSPDPPDYPVENIRVPTILFYTPSDILVSEQDVIDICEKMPGCIRTYRMRNPKWAHVDFLFSRNLQQELLQPLIEYMKDYE